MRLIFIRLYACTMQETLTVVTKYVINLYYVGVYSWNKNIYTHNILLCSPVKKFSDQYQIQVKIISSHNHNNNCILSKNLRTNNIYFLFSL